MARASLTCTDCNGKGLDAHGHPGCPACGGDCCGDCAGAGAPAPGCTVCGAVAAAPRPRPRPASPPSSGRTKAKKALIALGVLGALAALVFGGWKLIGGKGPDQARAPFTPPPTSSANVDPTKPSPPASATAVATAKKCPPGTLLDTERDVCVEKSSPPPVPARQAGDRARPGPRPPAPPPGG